MERCRSSVGRAVHFKCGINQIKSALKETLDVEPH